MQCNSPFLQGFGNVGGNSNQGFGGTNVNHKCLTFSEVLRKVSKMPTEGALDLVADNLKP